MRETGKWFMLMALHPAKFSGSSICRETSVKLRQRKKKHPNKGDLRLHSNVDQIARSTKKVEAQSVTRSQTEAFWLQAVS